MPPERALSVVTRASRSTLRVPSGWLAREDKFMSSTAAEGHPSTTDSDPSVSATDASVSASAGAGRLSAAQVREVVRLFQCPQCSKPLHKPITLPCGRSLCKRCLPEPHTRTNISYPATPNRMQGFLCPFPDCAQEHAVGDCGVDVILNKALTLVKAEFDKALALALDAGLSTHIKTKDGWEESGIPSLRELDVAGQTLHGGQLVATYALAAKGQLDYSAEISLSSQPPSPSGDAKDSDFTTLASVKEVTRLEMDCQVCYALYYDAVTTPCGHTYCRACLHRVLDHSAYCPVCRRQLSIQPLLYRQTCPANALITRITAVFWADILERRKHAVLNESRHGHGDFDTALFVCTLSFPAMPTFLHVFEPRYRLMIRRALEGDRTFGMVLYKRPGHSGDTNFVNLGTVLRIVNAEFYPDGRSILETVGISRFRIVDHGLVDGYLVAKTERINDISIAEEERLEANETRTNQGVQDLTANAHGGIEWPRPQPDPSGQRPVFTREGFEAMSTRELMGFVRDFVLRMKEQSVEWLTSRILAVYGECPDDPALFPWWFASILPLKAVQKYRLLETTSVRERLKMCSRWIMEWEGRR